MSEIATFYEIVAIERSTDYLEFVALLIEVVKLERLRSMDEMEKLLDTNRRGFLNVSNVFQV